MSEDNNNSGPVSDHRDFMIRTVKKTVEYGAAAIAGVKLTESSQGQNITNPDPSLKAARNLFGAAVGVSALTIAQKLAVKKSKDDEPRR